jgi:hypothetical protein
MHVLLAVDSPAAAGALAVPMVQLPAEMDVHMHLASSDTAVQQVKKLLQVRWGARGLAAW